jgi:tRNA threonylcarbamoyladenosine biosynthesis protein TsaE
MKLELKTLEDLETTARAFVASLGTYKVIAFRGEMAAGKTTFIKAVCKILGVTDEATSPTFSIVNEYLTHNGSTVYHFDFYRIEDLREAIDMGATMYFDSGNYCLIEWPEMIKPILPDITLNVSISIDNNGGRVIEYDTSLLANQDL